MGDNRIAQVEVIVFKVVENKVSFLLLKRAESRGGFWQPVTGGVDEGEEFKASAIREMQEETGILEYVEILEELHFFEFETNGGFGRLKEYVFGVQVDAGAESVISDEHSEQRWCSIEEALELLKYENNKVGFRKIAEIYGAKV
jgi:dATP pyrophosphohydrolase